MILYEIACETMLSVNVGPVEIKKAIAPLLAYGLISGGVKLVSGLFGASRASKRARREEARVAKLNGEMDNLERNRQTIVNPYAGVTSLSEMVSSVGSMASNPYANLAVSTGAAEMQIEQADIALANTLDTMRASGASAGGATALARMALESKKGVAAGIEQQEAQNQKMAAGGEERLQNVQMDEAKRVQITQLQDAERIQNVKAKGEIYEFETREGREDQQLNRKQAQITNSQQAASQARNSQDASMQSAFNAAGDIAGAFAANSAKG